MLKYLFWNFFIAGIPKKLFIKLEGKAKNIYSSREGIYILGSHQVNGKAYWIQKGGSNALWHGKENPYWFIGVMKNLGEDWDRSSIHSNDDSSVGPLEATSTWKCWKPPSRDIYGNIDYGHWIEATVLMSILGTYIFDNIGTHIVAPFCPRDTLLQNLFLDILYK